MCCKRCNQSRLGGTQPRCQNVRPLSVTDVPGSTLSFRGDAVQRGSRARHVCCRKPRRHSTEGLKIHRAAIPGARVMAFGGGALKLAYSLALRAMSNFEKSNRKISNLTVSIFEEVLQFVGSLFYFLDSNRRIYTTLRYCEHFFNNGHIVIYVIELKKL